MLLKDVLERNTTVLSKVNLPRVSQLVNWTAQFEFWFFNSSDGVLNRLIILPLRSLSVFHWFCFTTSIMFPLHPHLVYKCIFFNYTLGQVDL